MISKPINKNHGEIMAKKKEDRTSRFVGKEGDFTKVPPESQTAKQKAEVKKVIAILKKVQVVKEESKPKTRQVTETKSTCKACGNIWFYGKKDQWEQFNNQYNNSCTKPSLCCTCSPLALLMPDKKVVDLNKCPKCGSRAVNQEKVTHDV